MLFVNEWLWLAMLIACFSAIMLLYRFFGKLGLFLWMPISAILANIQVVKLIGIFGMTATLGNIVYASSFLVTDILAENHSSKEARQAVLAGLFTLAATTVIMQIALLFVPAADDFAQSALVTVFGLLPRLALAGFAAYAAAQFHDIWAYRFWRRRRPGRQTLWLRNNLSTMVSQLIDSLLFCFIAFWGLWPLSEFIQVLVTTYFLKWLTAALDTPLLYLARSWFEKKQLPTGN